MILNIILKGFSIPLLPKNILFIYDSFIIRVLRILGSFCVILCLCGYNIVYIGLFFEIGSIYLFLVLLLSIVRVIYGFYILCNINSMYDINAYSLDVLIYFILIFRILFMFVLDVLSFSIFVERFFEIFFNIYMLKKRFIYDLKYISKKFL